MSDYTTHIETVNLDDLAREEVEAAREAGIDLLNLALTHTRMAERIRRIALTDTRREPA